MKGRKRERDPSTSSSADSSSAAESSSSVEEESLSLHSEGNFLVGSEETSSSEKSSDLDAPAPRRGGHGHKGKNLSPSSPLHAPELMPSEIGDVCPRFTSIVTEDAPIKIEDLDSLQYEIEHLLVEVSKRKIFLDMELEQLNYNEGKNKKSAQTTKRKYDEKVSSKKSKEKPSKIRKQTHSKMEEYDFSQSPEGNSSSSVFGSSSAAMPSTGYSDPSVTITASGHIIKNDSPDMFWALVNSYCAVPTDEQLKALEDMISIYSDKETTSYLTGQPLPSPNATKALGERQEKEVLSPKSIGGNKKSKQTKHAPSSPANKRNELKNDKSDLDRDTYGPLTRRLVSALLEGSRTRINLEELWDEPGKDKNDTLSVMTGGSWKNFDQTHAVDFEAECERLLSTRGLLMLNNKKDDGKAVKGSRDAASSPVSSSCAASSASCSSSDDETNGVARLQKELRQVILKNEHALRRLLDAGRRAQQRAKLQERLAAIEADVGDSYKRLIALKKATRNKQLMSKKEKDQAWRAIKERDSILQQLRNIK